MIRGSPIRTNFLVLIQYDCVYVWIELFMESFLIVLIGKCMIEFVYGMFVHCDLKKCMLNLMDI